MEVYTIGFTRRGARSFFGALKEHGVRRLVDVRLNNVSQLAGFAKRDDLAFFLGELCGCEYLHEARLAPSAEVLARYRKGGRDWPEYEVAYRRLLDERDVEHTLDRSLLEGPAVLLCSEHTADRCHRRLAAEYLRERWGGFGIVHL